MNQFCIPLTFKNEKCLGCDTPSLFISLSLFIQTIMMLTIGYIFYI